MNRPHKPKPKIHLRSSISILMISLIIVLLTDSVFYYYTKRMLTSELETKLQLIADNVAISIKHSKTGEKYVENLIGQNLRTASLAAQYRLDPDIEKVTNEELTVLSKELMIDHITLMKRSGDDIIGYKSSEPKEINMSTKTWSRDWFQAFNQLLDTKETKVQSGQALPHYWSGPMNTSMTSPQFVDKWGYYYDGRTNYILDPYVHDTFFRDYQRETGVDAVINEMIHGYSNNGAKEIAVYNPPIFLKQQEQYKKEGYTWFTDREILFGSYTMKDNRDQEMVQAVMQSKQTKQLITTIDGKTYLKMFIPLQLDSPVVIGLTADYETVQQSIQQQQVNLLILIGSTALIAFILVILSIRFINRNREATAESIQEVYVDHIGSLFRSMKEQRHDFNNHVATIHSLVHLKEYTELDRYTTEIIGETTALNDIIQINVPALCAIVQSKVIQAVERKITFIHEVGNLNQINLGAVKATDLVRIISNLIDNAFDAVTISKKAEDKEVRLIGVLEGNLLTFKVINNGDPIPSDRLKSIFEPGFSTKQESGLHAGLGLSIVKKLVDKYNGTVQVSSSETETSFTISIVV
ncbi:MULTISPECIES: sensor histidine kinase [unclassified Paenibacillus]|uniref:sensor histidine kinase n=1 Tax=unclassified Paenibacillus TaxID=185978 RepID=UPI0007089DEA|nr:MULTISPECIES: ATP-binding protein [unclassified Paenibacillus]KQX48971.1 protein DctS [Paenibacillus sp. Root444D2]KRE36589.1 protein DctS [Paenibacillus sp. Soil724D2]